MKLIDNDHIRIFHNVLKRECNYCKENNEEITSKYYETFFAQKQQLYDDPKKYLIESAIKYLVKVDNENLQLEILNFMYDVDLFNWNKVFSDYIIEPLPSYPNEFTKKSYTGSEKHNILFEMNKFYFDYSSKQYIAHQAVAMVVNDSEYSNVGFNALKLLYKILTSN